MSLTTPERCVFFEPWSLGDVFIAASALRELEPPAALACHSMWHPLLRHALAEMPSLELIAADLPYTTRRRLSPFDAGTNSAVEQYPEFSEVLSIRGDLRDLRAARRMFPRAHIRMNGWVRFFGRKSALVNFPYSLGLLTVENRYRSWARLAGVSYQQMETTYRRRQSDTTASHQVVIHVGAQWRSKQYPQVVQLREALQNNGWAVKLLAGPRDPLPPDLGEEEVTRVIDDELIAELRAAGRVITNDSGPMHLAAFLGCKTTALVRTSPIEEWAPPATQIIRAAETPRGYRPHPRYMSDEILSGWPEVEKVVRSLQVEESGQPEEPI